MKKVIVFLFIVVFILSFSTSVSRAVGFNTSQLHKKASDAQNKRL